MTMTRAFVWEPYWRDISSRAKSSAPAFWGKAEVWTKAQPFLRSPVIKRLFVQAPGADSARHPQRGFRPCPLFHVGAAGRSAGRISLRQQKKIKEIPAKSRTRWKWKYGEAHPPSLPKRM